jgi:hypothetical protein
MLNLMLDPLALPTNKLGEVSSGRCREVGQKAIELCLDRGRVIAGRNVNPQSDGDGLGDVLTSDERARHESVELVAKGVTVASPIGMGDRPETVSSGGSKLATIVGGGDLVKGLTSTGNRNRLRFSEHEIGLSGEGEHVWLSLMEELNRIVSRLVPDPCFRARNHAFGSCRARRGLTTDG